MMAASDRWWFNRVTVCNKTFSCHSCHFTSSNIATECASLLYMRVLAAFPDVSMHDSCTQVNKHAFCRLYT